MVKILRGASSGQKLAGLKILFMSSTDLPDTAATLDTRPDPCKIVRFQFGYRGKESDIIYFIREPLIIGFCLRNICIENDKLVQKK